MTAGGGEKGRGKRARQDANESRWKRDRKGAGMKEMKSRLRRERQEHVMEKRNRGTSKRKGERE